MSAKRAGKIQWMNLLYFVTLVSVLMIIPSVQRIKYGKKEKKNYLNYNNCMKVAIFALCFSLNRAATSSSLAKVSIFSWFRFQVIPYNVDTFLSTLITGLSYSSIHVSLHCIMFTIEMNECWKWEIRLFVEINGCDAIGRIATK